MKNKYLLTPAIYYREINDNFLSKKGPFIACLKTPINIYSYNKNIPFEINIECPEPNRIFKNVNISILRVKRKNMKNNRNQAVHSENKEIVKKTIPLMQDISNYHIEDEIKIISDDIVNPKKIYEIFDANKKNYGDKFDDIELCPSCYGGLLGCEYYLKMDLEINNILVLGEFMIPIDFYEPYFP